MANTFSCEIHTPARLFFSEPVEEIVITLLDGECGILAGHTRFTAPTRACVLKLKKPDASWAEARLASGIIEVKKHKTVIITELAEWIPASGAA